MTHRLASLLVLLCAAAEACAAVEGARYVVELRKQGQFRAAEEYALRHWRRDDLPESERAELAIQLAILYTEWALAAPPEAQARLWSKADLACAAFSEGWPNNVRRSLVEVQRGLVSLAHGEHALAAGDIEPGREHLRIAQRRLTDAAEAVGRKLVDLHRAPATKQPHGALTVAELEALDGNLSLQIARCQRQLGLSYAPQTADRDDALQQAIQRLTPLAGRTPANEITWIARVDMAACLHELGRSNVAQQLVDRWQQENPPEPFAQRLQATASEQSLRPAIVGNDEFDIAMDVAAKANRANRPADASERYRRIALQNRTHARAAEAHRLAILCMARALRDVPDTERERLAKSYESLLNEHLATWPAGETAEEARIWLGRLRIARREWATATEVLQQIGPTSEFYTDGVRLLAQSFDNHLLDLNKQGEEGRAARANLLATATRILQPVITGTDNRWPESWNELQLTTALELARLHLRNSDGPSPYSERLLTAAIRAQPTTAMPEADKSWKSASQLVLIEALVRNDKPAEANAMVASVVDPPIEPLLAAVATIGHRLPRDVSSHTEMQGSPIGEIVLALIQRADEHRNELSPESIARLDGWRAAALAATGNRAAALSHYAALSVQQPENGDLQEQYATLLQNSDSAAELRQSLDRWQAVESRSRRGGPRWRRARSARIELLSRLGEVAEGEKLLRLTRLLYPDWELDAADAK
jgi:hypothetical protein